MDKMKKNNLIKINLISIYTILFREIKRILSIWKQTVLPAVINSILYLLIFGVFLGSRIGDVKEVDYILFLIPGLIMMQILTNSYSNVVSAFYMAKFQKFIEEILISPTYNISILIGYVLSGVFRGFLIFISILFVVFWFVDLTIFNFWLLILSFLLSSILFSLLGFFVGLFAKSFDDISIIPTFVILPLTYLGGVFFPLNILPEFWQNISLFNPMLYIINLFRYSFLGISDVSIYLAIFILIFFIILFFIINLILLRKRNWD